MIRQGGRGLLSGYGSVTAASVTTTGAITSGTQFLAPNGTAAAPGYAFTARPADGLFNETSRVAVAFGGTDKAYWGSVNHSYATMSVTGHVTASGRMTRVGNSEARGAKTASYTATDGDYFLACDPTAAAIVITLPAAATVPGQTYAIRKINASANAVTIDANAAETIDGALTLVIAANSSVRIICDGTAWHSI